MANTIRIYVEDPDTILATGNYEAGAIVRVQSCATKTGSYANLATAAIVAATRQYVIYDTAGTSSTWYRTRYENSGATVLSDWSDPFQAGTSEGICELADVRQRLNLAATDTSFDEDLADFIRVVTGEIIGFTGRQFLPDPPGTGTQTYVFDVPATSRTLLIPRGVRSVSSLAVASDDQPDTGGTYATTIASTDFYLRPLEHERDWGWPATRIELSSSYHFWAGRATAQVTGAFGWAAVPAEIANVGVNAVVRMNAARRSATQTADLLVGTADVGYRILAFLSPAERALLTWYRDRS